MSGRLPHVIVILAALLAATGCSSVPPGYRIIKPTTLEEARIEVPEEQLLDVGIEVSSSAPLSEKKLEKLGTNGDVRDAECYYVPFHLKNTMEMAGYWGEVQVVAPENDTVDLKITTTLVDSNGDKLQCQVKAVDAIGRVWLEEKYHASVRPGQYDGTIQGEREAFQDLYNTVANELAEFNRSLTPAEIEEIRTVSMLAFARDFAPDAFEEYIGRTPEGRLVVERLPAADDPLMARIAKIRERDRMFIDTLNQYYEGYYVDMWDPYENWRRFNHAEQEARRQMEQEAFNRIVGGALLIAAAAALGSADISGGLFAAGVLVTVGGQFVISGVNVSEQAKIHSEAIEELGDSFATEMRPTVMQLEGKQYELTGTASEQYREWKDLLRRIYYEETGFDPDTDRFVTDLPPAEIWADP